MQQIIQALLDQRSLFEEEFKSQTLELSEMHEKTKEMMISQVKSIREEIRRAYKAEGERYVSPRPPKSSFEKAGRTQSRREQWDWEEDHYERIESILIDGLQYLSMSQRYETIAKPHQHTFEWIYQKPQRDWSDFVKWLRAGNGIYWVNGKAGSGKTTLMRYIHDNIRTRQELSLWAGDNPLQISSFFFWNSGTLEQKSQSGLLRSLLFEILTKWKDLIPVVLPEQWQRRTTDNPWSVKYAPLDKWTEHKLKGAFQALVSQRTIPLQLCLFIDGLDEYDGSHPEIVKLFKNVVMSNNIKICVSSRPLIVFEHGFKGLPSLRLQDLTFADIRNFVTDKLAKNDQMQLLVNEEPERGPQLIVEIVSKAQGVFLWVDLVVTSLLNGLQNFDRISDLRRRVELLPPDLENLYKHMLQHIEPLYLKQASRILQLVRAAREQGELEGPAAAEPLTILMFSFAEEESEEYPKHSTEVKIKPLTDSEILSRCEAAAGRIKSRCRGLLEVHEYREIGYETTNLVTSKSEARVVYLHRTVRDFLEEPQTWERLLKDTSSNGFDVNSAWLKACLRRLKSSTMVNGGKLLATSQALALRIAFDALCYATRSYSITGADHCELLEELDCSMSQLYPKSPDSLIVHHWARGLTYDNPESYSGDVNLLTVATQFGLTCYLKKNPVQCSNIIQTNKGVPLLWYAISDASLDLCRSIGRSTKLDTIVLLLKLGAKPNQKITKTIPETVWQYLLEKIRSSALYTPDGQIFFRRLDIAESRDLARMFELFIKYKADPNGRPHPKTANSATPSALEIAKVFHQPYADQLQVVLLKSGAKIRRRDRRTISSRSEIYGEVMAEVTDARQTDKESPVTQDETELLQKSRNFLCFKLP
jgi:hypothetical protein